MVGHAEVSLAGWRVRLQGRFRRILLGFGLFGAVLPAAAGFTEGEMLAGGCGGCHGHTGVSTADAMPSIAGFDRRYGARVLREFRSGVRFSTIMGRLMAGYTAGEIAQLAGYFADQPWQGSGFQPDSVLAARGLRLHEAKCEECHEQHGRYQDRDMPRTAGQQPEYLRMQLFARRDRPQGMQQPGRMREAVATLSDEDIVALSHFLASQE